MKHIMILLCLLLLCSWKQPPKQLTSINVIDHHGMSQTISSKNRLAEFEKIDFLSPQSYQKVMRIYAKEKNGDTRSLLTSYHPNGQIKQYLEAVNNRANGTYCEWFANGHMKVQAFVIGGIADLNAQAEESWLFDGTTQAWDDAGHLAAHISYCRGELEGVATYYHPNGALWKQTPYVKGEIDGKQSIYYEDGSLLQTTCYCHGIKEGICSRYWPDRMSSDFSDPQSAGIDGNLNQIVENERTAGLEKIAQVHENFCGQGLAYREEYSSGKLQEAFYLSTTGERIATIHEGAGTRLLFRKEGVYERQEYQKGVQQGKIERFDAQGCLICCYQLKEGLRYGESIDYYPLTSQPKILMTWQEGQLQGPTKTWFENGTLESQREMSRNQKNGLLMGWYRNGSLMLVEEYDNDRLVKGEYFRVDEKSPISCVENGKGIAHLFDNSGGLCQKVQYFEGRPVE